jgi:hypothetical protein
MVASRSCGVAGKCVVVLSNQRLCSCIIRSAFLNDIKKAFDADKNLSNLLLAPFFKAKVCASRVRVRMTAPTRIRTTTTPPPSRQVVEAEPKWRRAASQLVLNGSWAPAILAALSYYEGYTSARLSHNLLQVQSVRGVRARVARPLSTLALARRNAITLAHTRTSASTSRVAYLCTRTGRVRNTVACVRVTQRA